METLSFGSGAFGAASAGGSGEGTGVGAVSLHAASASAIGMRRRTRIGARKIAEAFAVDKKEATALQAGPAHRRARSTSSANVVAFSSEYRSSVVAPESMALRLRAAYRSRSSARSRR